MPITTPPPPLEIRASADLIHLARATRPDIARESLKVLARRNDPAASDVARDLLLHHADQNVRSTAAVMLGRDPGGPTQEVLIYALSDPNPAIVRRVAQSLGRVGGVQALHSLQRVTVADNTPAGRAVMTARTLLSYRLGRNDHLVDPDRSELVAFRVTRGADITWNARLKGSLASVAADAARELPGVEIDPKAIAAFVCSGQSGAFIANPAVTTTIRAEAFALPTLAGALLRERPCSERYTLDAYVLVDDRDDTAGKAVHVWLMRPDGILLHHGRARITDDGIDFTIAESNPPYSPPVRIEGTVDERRGAVAVTTALVGKPRSGSRQASTPEARTARPS